MRTKDRILLTLEIKKGEFVSGEALAEACGVSRSAVWKSITELKKKGYRIRSVNNRGYMLETDNDIISYAGICNYLSEKDPSFWEDAGRRDRIHVFEKLDSTNNEAKRSLLFSRDRVAHGTVFVARIQTAGKGHGGSAFSSPEGGIYLSILLDPKEMEERTISKLTKAIGNATKYVLESDYGILTERQENSTFFYRNKKICGILSEGICDLETGVFSNYIVGIGIHVEQFGFDSDRVNEKNAVIADLIHAVLAL